LHIKAKSRVSNVIIAENVTYGDGVTFTNVKFRTKVVSKATLKGHINGSNFTIPSPIGYLLDICFVHCAKRISRNSYIGLGKSYLIPETTKFDIGEGIDFKETYTKVESVTIRANSHLANLDIGANVKFEDGVTIDDSVTFSVHQRYMETYNIDVLPSLAGLTAIDSQSNSVSTWARLQGGARFGATGSRGERYRKQRTLKRSKHKNVDVFANVLTDVKHIGQKADILVVAAYTPVGVSSPTFYMLDNQGTPLPWDMDMSSLVPFRAEVTLAGSGCASYNLE